MADPVLSEAELRFLTRLQEKGVRFLVVGMGAALLQGARGATEDMDLWFEDLEDLRLRQAAREAGGFFVGFGQASLRPPMFGGALGERLNVVVGMHGLDCFSKEYAEAANIDIVGISLRVLPLERVLQSKRAANRPKDRAAIPALEEALAAREER